MVALHGQQLAAGSVSGVGRMQHERLADRENYRDSWSLVVVPRGSEKTTASFCRV